MALRVYHLLQNKSYLTSYNCGLFALFLTLSIAVRDKLLFLVLNYKKGSVT